MDGWIDGVCVSIAMQRSNEHGFLFLLFNKRWPKEGGKKKGQHMACDGRGRIPSHASHVQHRVWFSLVEIYRSGTFSLGDYVRCSDSEEKAYTDRIE